MNYEEINKIIEKIKSLYSYEEIILGVNHKCNLNCQFCYLNYNNSIKTQELKLYQYKKLFKEAKKLGVQDYKIAEKEPFCTPIRTFKIINLLRKTYFPKPVEISLVTNGTLAHEHISKAKKLKVIINHMIFSIDGKTETNQALRKISDKSITTTKILQTASEYLNLKITKKIWFNSVLTNLNYKEIPSFIKQATRHNPSFKNFSIDIFNYNPEKKNFYLSTTKTQFLSFVKKIIKTAKENKINITLTILGNRQMKPYIKWLKESSLIKGKQEIDANLFYVDTSNFPLKIYYQIFPTEYIRSIRISSDGYLMGIGKEILKSNYKKHAIGNIKTSSLKTLWDKIRKKSTKAITEEYFTETI